jgi:hypothetical protein
MLSRSAPDFSAYLAPADDRSAHYTLMIGPLLSPLRET